jgi:predicted amidohydrolase YtcJ
VTVFRNGPVFRADAARTSSRAVAVRDGVVVAVGGDDDVAPYLARAREIVDLEGRLLLPGFTDAHAHPLRGGLERLRCHLLDVSTPGEYLRVIAEYADANPGRRWIIGGGWATEAFPDGGPTRELLDSVVADRPVCLAERGHHTVWVNSRALELAGIDASTPDPSDGRIERDASGQPTGLLHEGASRLVDRCVPPETADDYDEALREAQRFLHSHGVVGWMDAMVLRPGPGAASHETYRRAQRKGWLTARVVAGLWWDRSCDLDDIPESVAELVAARDARGTAGSRYSAGTVKVMLDGVVETRTASLLEPYLDACGHPTDETGLGFLEPDLLRAVVTALDAAGFQVHFHALGDRAVRDALDAVEAAQEANRSGGRRHQIAHLQVVHPDDVPRFRRLGVGANLQGLWAAHDPHTDRITDPILGAARASAQYPFGDLERSGAPLVMGSDWPVSDAEPMAAVHTVVNRIQPGAPEDALPLGPQQRLTLASALAAYTAGSAWANGDDKAGTIAVGHRADLVILDRDPFELAPERIAECRVSRTYVDGRLVYEN